MSAAPVVSQPLPQPPTSAPANTGGTIRADLRREYAAGGTGLWNAAFLRALPRAIDDATADLGDDLYERMLFDARIAAEHDNLRAAVLEDGVVLAPAVDDADADGYDLAVTIADAAQQMLADLDPALDDTLWDLASALAMGNRVAEQSYDYGDVAGRTGLVLRSLRVKPRDMLSFVVDPFNRLIGLLATIPGVAQQAGTGLVVAGATPPPNLLPREKFAVYSHRPVNGDPRGTSLLRAAYTPWTLKQEALRQHIKYLAQFASPSVVGNLGPNDRDSYDDATESNVRAVDTLLTSLLTFQNGTALALPYDSKVQLLFSQGEGAAFLRAFAMYNLDITQAITGQSLASTEGEHQARAAASVHQDILATRVRQAKLGLARVIRRDVLTTWVRLNWGDAAATALVPRVNLGTVEEEDVTPRMTAIANLERAGYLAPSQRPAVDVLLGLPQRLPTETAIEAERHAAPPTPPPGTPGDAPDAGTAEGEDRASEGEGANA